ncbi:MAG: DEAD/DEAH box helicase [Verrucomicrobiota bacterium]|nr:DEAD/DEAH box helicase [Verrucomicrobiota bacterium]
MISNGPSRTFTREAVEAWLHRLSLCDWEKSIDRNLLNKAQTYYRKGLLSALDIQSEQVIITQKVNREETYSVVEWKNGKPEIRTSLDDENLGFVLGTAGLYEIEELIAEIQDEDPLFGQLVFDNEILQSNSEIIEESNQNNDDEVIEAPTLELIVSLDISLKKGLLATPKWKLSEKEETKVYGSVSISTDQETDRPALMRFVAEANDKGFSFDKENGTFLLSDWNRIAHLSDEFLPMWEKSFNLRLEGEAKLLKHGQRTLNWEIEARSRSEESMALRERFQLGSHKLGRESIRKISRAKLGATFIRGHGLVKLDQKQIDDFDWWQRNRGDLKRTNWPKYMLFSLFARKYLKTRPDGKLADWEDSIRKLETNGVAKRLSFLRPYQKQGVAQIYALHQLGCHALLADEMGLGKTIQSLALLSKISLNESPDLVVCPASVVQVWVKEAKEKFPSLKVRILNQENKFSHSEDPCVWVASYTQLRRHRNLLDNITFRYAILDEAQLIKNPKAKTTQTCLSINAKNRLALSGTPIENSALDLWTIFRFLMPGLLGGRKEFERSFEEDSRKSTLLVRKQIKPFVLRRLKSEVAKELPPKIETELPCQLSDEQKREYRKITELAIHSHGNDLSGAIKTSPTHIFSILTRLRQACCDLSLLPGRQHLPPEGIKTDLLIEKLHDLIPSGAKVLVFSQFTSFLSILRKRIRLELPELNLFELTGNTRDRSIPVESFENEASSALMLASLKAAGLGVTLKSADYVFLMDPWWNPAAEDQAIDRAHRIGKDKPTFIYRIIAKGTVEDRVRQLQLNKKETFNEIIGELEKPSGLSEYFSTLKELVDLQD